MNNLSTEVKPNIRQQRSGRNDRKRTQQFNERYSQIH